MKIGKLIQTLGKTVSILILFLSGGCAAPPFPYSGNPVGYSSSNIKEPYFQDGMMIPLETRMDSDRLRHTNDFRTSPTNKYAIIIEGREFKLASKEAPCDSYGFISTLEPGNGWEALTDKFTENDVHQTAKLSILKGYDTYIIDMAVNSVDTLNKLFDKVGFLSNNQTNVLVAYSGEGNKNGLLLRSGLIGSMHFVPAGYQLTPDILLNKLWRINGNKALILNACESGIFVDKAARYKHESDVRQFNGVIIAACPQGYATTPCESTGTSAVYAAFLGLYVDDPLAIKNLATVSLNRAGTTWSNMRHNMADLFDGGLPISYDIVIYNGNDFLY